MQRLQISNIQFNCRLIWLKRKVEWELSDDIHLSLTGQINRLVMVEVLTPHSSLLFWFISCPTSKDQANRWYSTFHFRMKTTEVRSASLGEAECISLFLFSSNVYSQSGGGWKLKDKEMLMESSMQCILYSYDRLNQSKFSPPWIFHLIYENLYFSANIKFCKIPYDLKTDIL